jgi:hypothetical protein
MGDTSDLDQQIEQLRKCEVIKASEFFLLILNFYFILYNFLSKTSVDIAGE